MLPDAAITATNLMITQVIQVTLLVGVAGLGGVVLAPRYPRLMSCVWGVVALKALTPPLWASPTGVFSWAQAAGLAGSRARDPRRALLASRGCPAAPRPSGSLSLLSQSGWPALSRA
ncbi:MAG: hypothetical protein ACRCT8_17805 [Lacipirellulaceae bacterium]